MPLCTSEAIVLDVVDLHEYDSIVTLLTRDFGKRRGVARGARRRFSRFRGQLQPLDLVGVTWFEKPDAELVRLSSIDTIRSAAPLLADLEGILLAAYLAEHMTEFAQESEENDHLFRLLDATVRALLAGADRSLALRYFEAWVLRLSGLLPVPGTCPECGRPLGERDARLTREEAAIVCRECGAGCEAIGAETLAFLRRIRGESLERMAASPPSEAALAEVERLCARIRRLFLQFELKSHRVMRETLAGLPQGES
jgi:DNA repair protein RecO (recombination protein O)